MEFDSQFYQGKLENLYTNSISFGEKIHEYELYFPHNNVFNVLKAFKMRQNENNRRRIASKKTNIY
jgi:hypothetical protein